MAFVPGGEVINRSLLLSLLALCLLFVLPACDVGDDDDDATPLGSCQAELVLAFPDGTETVLDGCESYDISATYEFDPDDPPEVRGPVLSLYATTETAFECWVRIEEPQACGEGYYLMDGSSGSVTFDIHDCAGVPDAYEAEYASVSGFVHMTTLSAGGTAGNFSGEPLATTMAGSLSIATTVGVVLTGNFAVTVDVVADDAEEFGCAVSDGDEDEDGFIANHFGGTDCNDTSAEIYPGSAAQAQGMNLFALCGGTFEMGCTATPQADGNCGSDESPAHSVTLTNDFWISETEVTQAQWQALMANNPSSFSSCGASCPVERVNWYEAVAFANALSSAEGLAECYTLSGCTNTAGNDLECSSVTVNSTTASVYDCEGYRLPTEAEWEYAARAETDLLYAGSDVIDEVCWHDGNSGSVTQPVATKLPNAWGLSDMSGNVWEWCWDWYASDYYSSGPETDPTGASTGSGRVYRGGSSFSPVGSTRVANRHSSIAPGNQNHHLGFRLSRTIP